ncbi:MAG: hypothetical protein JZU50_09215 [Desulfobulbaceae bacterium]|nr:hypothetical protein [Desulfobulbaceae bacterium]
MSFRYGYLKLEHGGDELFRGLMVMLQKCVRLCSGRLPAIIGVKRLSGKLTLLR